MSETFERILTLVDKGDVNISDHGYDELAEDDILAKEVIEGLTTARIIEDYPDYPKGPCVLVLEKKGDGTPIHVVWGIPKGKSSPAVLVTAYRPDPARWTEDFLRRRT